MLHVSYFDISWLSKDPSTPWIYSDGTIMRGIQGVSVIHHRTPLYRGYNNMTPSWFLTFLSTQSHWYECHSLINSQIVKSNDMRKKHNVCTITSIQGDTKANILIFLIEPAVHGLYTKANKQHALSAIIKNVSIFVRGSKYWYKIEILVNPMQKMILLPNNMFDYWTAPWW